MDVYDNYISLLNIHYKEHISIFILPIIIFILIILSSSIEIYDNSKFGYVFSNNCYVLTIPIQNSDNVIHANYVTLNNKNYQFDVDEVIYDYKESYQTLVIKVPTKADVVDNQVGTITFNYNKEKIIKKIFRLLF